MEVLSHAYLLFLVLVKPVLSTRVTFNLPEIHEAEKLVYVLVRLVYEAAMNKRCCAQAMLNDGGGDGDSLFVS